MEDEILESLLLRKGMEDEMLLIDMIRDSMAELRAMLNYEADEDLPEECSSVVKELVLIRYNRDGTEGIVSESQSSGGSTTYTDQLPDRVKRIIRRHRRLPRRYNVSK